MKVKDVNPFTGKKGKRYQVDGKRIYEKFVEIKLNGVKCVLSSLGSVMILGNGDDSEDFIYLTSGISNGTKVVTIRNNVTRTSKKYRVHRLVAEYFLPKKEKDIRLGRDIVCFKNRNKEDIKPENLIWVNQAEMFRISTFDKYIKELSSLRKKVKSSDVVEARELKEFLLNPDYTYSDIMNIFNLNKYEGIKSCMAKKRKELRSFK